MTDDREPFREARAAGLKARHEQRLENATYTAAEVKVLTEAALRLGRKEALDEVRDWIGRQQHKRTTTTAKWSAYMDVAAEVGRLQPSPDATSGRTDPEDGA